MGYKEYKLRVIIARVQYTKFLLQNQQLSDGVVDFNRGNFFKVSILPYSSLAENLRLTNIFSIIK